jgi:hypothetical protein
MYVGYEANWVLDEVIAMEDPSKIRQDLNHAIEAAMEEIIDFASAKEFQAVLSEMFSLPPHLRYEFVELVWLDKTLLRMRGLKIPEGLVIQRSEFADKRPTLFCVSKVLPPGLGWHKVTITFDNPASVPLGVQPVSENLS